MSSSKAGRTSVPGRENDRYDLRRHPKPQDKTPTETNQPAKSRKTTTRAKKSASTSKALPDDTVCHECGEDVDETDSNNDIVECSGCKHCYHQKCHTPTISKRYINSTTEWLCSDCIEKGTRKRPSTASKASRPGSRGLKKDQSGLTKKPGSKTQRVGTSAGASRQTDTSSKNVKIAQVADQSDEEEESDIDDEDEIVPERRSNLMKPDEFRTELRNLIRRALRDKVSKFFIIQSLVKMINEYSR